MTASSSSSSSSSLSMCLTFLLLPLSLTSGYIDLPVGVLMDHSKEDLSNTAFMFGMSAFSKQVQRFRIANTSLPVQMDNSFKVGTAICSLLRKGVLANFGVHDTNTLNTVKSYSESFNVPYVTSAMAVNTTNQDKGYDLYIRPYYVKAIIDLIKHYKWKEVHYFYSSNEGLERLQQLFDAATDEGYLMRTNVFRVQTAEDVHKILQKLDATKSGDKKILLDLPTAECQKVISMESNYPKVIKHSFILIGLSINELSIPAFNTRGLEVTGLTLVDMTNEITKNIIIEWNNFVATQRQGGLTKMEYDPNSAIPIELALIIDSAYFMGVSLSTIINKYLDQGNPNFHENFAESLNCDSTEPIQPWKHGSDVIKSLREMNVTGLLTGTINFDRFGLRRGYKLDVMEVSLSGALAKIGKWDPDLGLLFQPSVRQKRSSSIENRTRIITSILTEPFLMLRPGNKWTGNDRYEGYCADLAKAVAEMIGFDYVIEPVKDSRYGSFDDGMWSGMVGELIRGEADMAIAPLTITASRERVIEFSKPFMNVGISIMIKKPMKDKPGTFAFLNPFTYEVWICIIFAYIGIGVVLFLVKRFNPFKWPICTWIVKSLGWFFTIILVSLYMAGVGNFLTAERMVAPIASADDLAKQTQIKYGTVHGGSTQEFFKRSTIPTYERMWAFMSASEPNVFVESTEEGVRRVREGNGRYAFLTESSQIDYISQRRPCDTMKIGGNLDSRGYGIGTPIGSDLRDKVSLAILELFENEYLAKLEKKWWYDKGECAVDGSFAERKVSVSLKLSNIAGVFYTVIIGIILSLIALAIGYLYKMKMEAKSEKLPGVHDTHLVGVAGKDI